VGGELLAKDIVGQAAKAGLMRDRVHHFDQALDTGGA
jgi:hypothetical protein